MQGATRLRLMLLPFAIAAVFVAVPATALARPKPTKYVLVRETKGCLVTLNDKTGKLTFKPEKGHFGRFTVVIKHGKKKITYRFTVTKSKVKSKPPVVTVIRPPGTSPPIIIIEPTVPVVGPAGPPGRGTPTTPPTPTPSPTPPTAAHPPVNLSPPVLGGTPIVGDTITLTYGTWSDSTSQTGTWYDCNAQGTQCAVDASQPPGDLYVVQAGDVGHTLLLAETATGPGGKTTVDSKPTAVVVAPVHMGASPHPAIHGSLPPADVLASVDDQCLDNDTLCVPEVQCDTFATDLAQDAVPACNWASTLAIGSGPSLPDAMERSLESEDLCADLVTVLTTISNEGDFVNARRNDAAQPGTWVGAGQWYMDDNTGSPPDSPGPIDNCYMLVWLSNDQSSTPVWKFVMNFAGQPQQPFTSITTLIDDTPVSVYPYAFPFTADV
jgi:hypothetical protein